MASVTNIQTTGDNDPELFPVRYVNHYLYCDRCGSFDLDYWSQDDEPRVPGLAGLWWRFLKRNNMANREQGIRCRACLEIYRHGSVFFTDPGANPMKFTMADVPKPLYRNLQIRGETLD